MRKDLRAIIHIAIFIFVTGSLLAQPGSTLAEQQSPQITGWVRFTPSVIWCGDTVRAEFHAVGSGDIAKVQLWGSQQNPFFPAKAMLYDDGANGDLVAGDNIFTVENLQPYCDPGMTNYVRGLAGTSGFYGDIFLEDKRVLARVNVNGIPYDVGVVDPSLKGVFQVKDFGDGLTATAYAFFIEDSRHEVMDDYPVATVYCGTSNFNAYRKLYSVLPDVFDFALVMPGLPIYRPQELGINVPYAIRVSNDVRHIGVPVFDNTAKFGSDGRLKSTVYHDFGHISVMDHELGHTWGMDIGDSSLGLIDGSTGHFVALSDLGGQMGGYYLSPGYFDNPGSFDPDRRAGHFAANGDGSWRLIPNTEILPYSPLELYVMGLIPASEVPPIHILESPDFTDPEHIQAQIVRTVTIEDILRVEGGERIPSVADSQKDFNLAFIVTQDVSYNEAAYAFFSILSMELMSKDGPDKRTSNAPFYWATGGRATLNTRLPVDLPEPLLPQPTPTPAPPTRQPDPSAQPGGFECAAFPAGLVLAISGWTWRRKRKL